MPNLPKAGAELVLDTGKWNSDFNRIIADSGKLDAALGDAADSARKIGSALDGISSVDVKINVTDTNTQSLLDLDQAVLTPKIDPTINDAPIKAVTDLDSTVATPKIDAQETSSGDAVLDRLDEIRNLQVINIALEVTGGMKDFVEKFGQIGGFAGVLELDSALATIQARTGEMLPGAEHLILDLYKNGWGESRSAIAEVITQADNLGISQGNLSSAVENALILQATYGEDTSETLRAMDSLVKNELAVNFDEAADILITGFQEGANRGQDLLDTFNEYGSTFARFGLSGTLALSLINTGLKNGIDNSDRVADAIREIGIRMVEIGQDEAITTAFKQLDKLSDIDLKSILDAYRAGTISGDDYLKGFFEALEEATAKDPEAAARIATSLVGTQAEDFGIETFSKLADAFDGSMGTIEGRAADAGNAISNSLTAQVDELFRSVEVAAQDFLSSEQIDLPGKIAAIKEGLTQAIDVLQAGGTLGEALEVGFKIQGVDEFIEKFQSAMGNFVIAVLQVVASLQELLPGGNTGEGTRAEIARLSEGQLAFDLKVANPDEVAGMLRTAAERGVDPEAIGAAASTAVEEMLKAGNIGAAQDLIDQIRIQGTGFTLSPELNPSFGEGVFIQQALNKWIAEGNLDMINDAIEKGIVVEPESMIDVASLQGQVTIAAQAFMDEFNNALATGDIDTATAIADQLDSDELREQIAVAAEALALMNQEMAEDSAAIQLASNDAAGAVGDDFQAMGEAARQLDADVTQAVSGGSIVPEFLKIRDTALFNFPLVAASEMMLANASKVHFGIVSSWARVAADSLMGFGNVLPILDLLITKLGQASAAATTATAQVNGIPTAPGGGGAFNAQPVDVGGAGVAGGAFSATSNNVYNNFYVQSLAQADTAGYSVARQIRGMG